MALNVGEMYNGYAEGSLFALGLRNARPFEAYVANSSAAYSPYKIFPISFDHSEIQMHPIFTPVQIVSEGTILKISGLIEGDIISIVNMDGIEILRLKSTETSISLDKPILGPVVITVMRTGRCIYRSKLIL